MNSSGALRTDARISPGGRVELTNQTLKALIRIAYSLPDSLTRLVDSLSAMLRRLVIDRTGLAGNFDFELTWEPEPRSAGDVAPFDPNAPVFTALQEQLGLKLEATKAPVDVLVVDRAEKPAED